MTDYVYTVRMEEGRPVETIHGEGCVAVTGYAPREFLQNANLWIDMVVAEDRKLVTDQATQILRSLITEIRMVPAPGASKRPA